MSSWNVDATESIHVHVVVIVDVARGWDQDSIFSRVGIPIMYIAEGYILENALTSV